jgi:type I restriction enzyme S subunit
VGGIRSVATKQTVIGEIPESWKVVSLAEKFETQLGKMLSQKARQGENPNPYMRNANVQWGRVDIKDVSKMDFTSAEQEKFKLRNGDLLVCEGGEIGRTALWLDELPECYFQKAIHRLRPKSDDTLPRFFLYWMERCFRFANVYKMAGARTTIAHLPQDKLEQLKIPLPSIGEQRAIVRALDAVRKAEEAWQREIEFEREHKAAVMEDLFTHGTRGGPTRQTEIGKIPESWQAVKIDAIIRLKQYGLSLRGNGTGSVPILRMNNLAEGKVDLTNLQWVDLDVRTESSFVLRPGDLLFNRTNSQDLVGKVGLFDHSGRYVFASYLVRLTFNETVATSPFVNAYLNLASTQRRLKGIASRGVSQSNISAGKLGNFLVPLPALDEQREIAAVSDAFDRRINSLAREEVKLGELFRAMLDELMTGKLSAQPLTQEHQNR